MSEVGIYNYISDFILSIRPAALCRSLTAPVTARETVNVNPNAYIQHAILTLEIELPGGAGANQTPIYTLLYMQHVGMVADAISAAGNPSGF